MDSQRMAEASPGLAQRAPAGTAAIDIVIPVYNAVADLARCVDSVLAHTAREHALVLIDDASPDPSVGAYFQDLARRGLPHVTLLRNDSNLGFTATANRGLLRTRADVVLLNSDTIVTRGWLDALARCIGSDPRIGTATPFSNNAEICSFPRFCENNPWPAGADPEPVRSALARSAAPSYPDLPTGVGFCLYVRRALLDAIGTFDPAFGHGYGEENDFCLRAAKAGFRNVLCDDAFVLHAGERSFEGRKADLSPRNLQLLLERHPEYLDLVHRYIAADPLAPIRAAALTQQSVLADPGNGVLHLIHGHGGGTEHHARALIDASPRRFRHYLATATDDVWKVEEQCADGGMRAYRFRRLPDEPWREFVGGLCATFGIGLIHLHNVSGCREGILTALAALGIPYGYTLHDLNFACPTITFLGADGMYCGAQTDPETCRRCLAAQPPFAGVDIMEWRTRHGAVLAGAAFLSAPSQWVAHTVARYFPGHAVEVIPLAAPGVFAAAASPMDGEATEHTDGRFPLVVPDDDVPTVAVLGAIGPDKGARRLEHMVELVREQGLRMRFVLIGYLDCLQSPWQSEDAVFTIHGRYAARDLPALLAHYHARLVAFPSAGPETFSFTLSESWAAGQSVVVPPIGALAERVAGTGAGWTLTDDEWADDARMLARIAAIVAPESAPLLAAASARARAMPQQTPEAMAERALSCYGTGFAAAAATRGAPAVAPMPAARTLAALGYAPWHPPAPEAPAPATVAATPAPEAPAPATVAATPATPAAPADAKPRGRVARLALRWGATPLGRALRRLTPAPILEALKARLL
jgi:GT2 family glycosyltransferase/glycosyltransferase involved in cell wall biosynthesis